MRNDSYFNMIKDNLDEYLAEFIKKNPKLAKLCDETIILPNIESNDENK